MKPIQNWIALLVIAALVSLGFAQLNPQVNPNFRSPAELRGLVNNTLFFDPQAIPVVNLPQNVESRLGNVQRFPSLGLPDVGIAFAQADVPFGSIFPVHVHPRGTEMLLVISGVFKITISPELTLPDVDIVARPGQLTVIPQGLRHFELCLTKPSCRFISSFRAETGDPGIVFE